MAIVDYIFQTSTSVFLLWTLLVLLLVYLALSFVPPQEDQKGPPGPRPLPLLGNLLQLDLKRPYETLLKFSRKYGSVFTVYFGPKKVVVLVGYQAVKEALVNRAEEFGERDLTPILEESSKGHGILWSNGDSWREMRRFGEATFREFLADKKAWEDKIIDETQHLIKVFRKFKGQAFDTNQPMNYAISNIICSMVYGSRFQYDDPEFISLVERIYVPIELTGSPSLQLYNLFPCIGPLVPNKTRFLQLSMISQKKNLEIFRHLKETLNPEKCRGFADKYLLHQQQLEASGITNIHFHIDNLAMTVIHLFAAATNASSASLKWGLLFMAKYPEIQDQVREELTRVAGSRQVQEEDRKNLPFTNAVIHEVQRFASIIPISIPRKTSQDVTFQGHFIKKGTAVYPLLTSVLLDETEWERPQSFYPAHFLDNDGNFVKRDAFLPFSAGQRACLGEGLARVKLFIIFSTLLQHFRFTPPPGVSEDELDLTPVAGVTLIPSQDISAVPVSD
ncbi:cytochrome P450 2K1-like [Echeneis naucrates]|uniref:Cytochrome P450 2K1-like n=1 Tax=Echeneis naucrates TaxID=173247 RepID=A0A665UFY1_ECHNA|nr:cytochrome P450 2K1-like [Echeneis naucrates]